jgi:two-component system nitrate/nitrite response regulator NarL
MTRDTPRRVILADDHPALRESIASHIEDHHADRLRVVAQVGDGESAVAAAEKYNPDVILLDLGLPRLDGIAATRRIKAARPNAVVLIFSMYEDQAHIVESLRAGADDYLFKRNAAAAQVVEAIYRALDERVPARDQVRNSLLQAIRGADRLDTGAPQLTGMELEVMKRVGLRGMSMKEIAADLGRAEAPLSEHTIRKHLEHIYDKLGARGQAHAVALAIRHGLISPHDAQPADRG